MKQIIIAAALAVTATLPAFAFDTQVERQFYTSNSATIGSPTRSVQPVRGPARAETTLSMSNQRERAFISSNPL